MHSVRPFRSGGRANARKVQKRTMDKKGKQQFLLVAFGVALYAALMNLNEVAAFLTRLATLFTPVIIGLLMAFVLSVPMQGIAGRLTRLMPKAKEKHIDLLSLLLTLLCVVIVVVLLCVLALPQLAASLKSIGTLVRENWPDWARLLSDHGVDTSELTDRIAALDWKTVLEKTLTGAGGDRGLRDRGAHRRRRADRLGGGSCRYHSLGGGQRHLCHRHHVLCAARPAQPC